MDDDTFNDALIIVGDDCIPSARSALDSLENAECAERPEELVAALLEALDGTRVLKLKIEAVLTEVTR